MTPPPPKAAPIPSVSAPGAHRASFLTRAPPVTFYGVH